MTFVTFFDDEDTYWRIQSSRFDDMSLLTYFVRRACTSKKRSSFGFMVQ